MNSKQTADNNTSRSAGKHASDRADGEQMAKQLNLLDEQLKRLRAAFSQLGRQGSLVDPLTSVSAIVSIADATETMRKQSQIVARQFQKTNIFSRCVMSLLAFCSKQVLTLPIAE
mgnify:CR=1 FL=1